MTIKLKRFPLEVITPTCTKKQHAVLLEIRVRLKIKQIRLRNFRSFGSEPVAVALYDLNLIVGPNAPGKTDLLRSITYVGVSLKSFGPGPDTGIDSLGN